MDSNLTSSSELVHPAYFKYEINKSNKLLKRVKDKQINQLKIVILIISFLACIFPIYHFFIYSPPIEVIVEEVKVPTPISQSLKEEVISYNDEFQQIGSVLRYLIERTKEYDKAFSLENNFKNKESKKFLPFSLVRVIVDKANLRPNPSLESTPLMTVSKGIELLVDTKDINWIKVLTPNGKKAWVSNKVIEWVKQD